MTPEPLSNAQDIISSILAIFDLEIGRGAAALGQTCANVDGVSEASRPGDAWTRSSGRWSSMQRADHSEAVGERSRPHHPRRGRGRQCVQHLRFNSSVSHCGEQKPYGECRSGTSTR